MTRQLREAQKIANDIPSGQLINGRSEHIPPAFRQMAPVRPVAFLTDLADPGIVCPSSEMTWASIVHAAIRVQTPREVGPGQEGAKGGAALLHHLDAEPNPLALLPHDTGDSLDQPAVWCGRVEGGQTSASCCVC